MSALDRHIENAFMYHPPHGTQVPRYGGIRQRCKDLVKFLAANWPESDELAMAITKVEEACMWANAAIARNEHGE